MNRETCLDTLLPLTSTILPTALTRIDVAPDLQNGLHIPLQVMVHRVNSVRREEIGAVIGHLDDVTLLAVSRAMVVSSGWRDARNLPEWRWQLLERLHP